MPEQQQQGQDNSYNILWGVALLIGTVILGWYFGRVYISNAVFYVRIYEIIALDFVLDLMSRFINLLGLPALQFSFF